MAINTTPFLHENQLKTTDSSFHDIIAHTVVTNASGFFTYRIVAQRTSNKATVTWTVHGGYKKVGTADPVAEVELLGNLLGSAGDKLSLLGVQADLSYDPNNIILRVKGNGNDIIWEAVLDGYEMYES